MHTLIPETYAYCIIHGKRIFADIFNVIDFTMERLSSVIWVWISSYELLKKRISPAWSSSDVAEEITGIRIMRRETYSCCFEDGEAKVKRNAGDLLYLKRWESCWLTTNKKTQISVPQLQELNSTNLSSHELKRWLLLGRKVMTNLDSILKKQRRYFANKGPSSQGCGFSSSHIWMWELDYKESLAVKYWCFWTVVLENTLESPLDCKEIQAVHLKGKLLHCCC